MRSWLTIILTGALLIACHRDHPKKGGNGGGGGGQVARSTPEQVQKAIQEARELVAVRDARHNIFAQFVLSVSGKQREDKEKGRPLATEVPAGKLFDVTSQLNQPERWELKTFAALWDKAPAIRLFENPVNITDKGSCANSEHKQADASVSQNNLDGRLCLSIHSLTRIPPQNLLQSILALLAHESAHLAGQNEFEAQEMQDLFNEFYVIFISNLYGPDVAARFEFLIAKIEKPLDFLINQTKPCGLEPCPPVFPAEDFIKEIRDGLFELPSIFEPIKLKIALRPARPTLVDHLGYDAFSALDILHKIVEVEVSESDAFYKEGVKIFSRQSEELKIKEWSPRPFHEVMLTVKALLKSVKENWTTFVTGNGNATCEGLKMNTNSLVPLTGPLKKLNPTYFSPKSKFYDWEIYPPKNPCDRTAASESGSI
ncbi:MAG: hypothetical protein AB7F86_09415 [Bdellovibrionales bacterium]